MEELVGEADDEEPIILGELLFEAVDEGAALVVEGLERGLYVLQLLLLLEVLVLLGG